jgi:hypothetical protein
MRLAYRSATVTLLVLLAVPAAQAAPDLTGTYTGKAKCSGFIDGQPVQLKPALTVTLDHATPASNLIRGVFELTTDVPLVGVDGCGFVIGDEAKPDQARAAIGAGNAPNEAFFTADLSQVKVFPVNKAGKSGKLKGQFLIAIRPNDSMLSCKLTADRTSTTDPGFAACPAP